MRTLAFINLKGGTGKTVSAANMAHILATVHHKKVLLVDGDKQGNASRYFRLYGEQNGTAELLMQGPELMNIAAAIYPTQYKGLDITTNGHREKTDWDKVQEVTNLRALLEKKRRFEKIPGETRKIIAEQLGTTPAQVGRYDSIAKHLISAFKTWLEEGKINISVAYELSTMSEREQLTALDRARAMRRGLSIDEVKRLREELRTPEPQKPASGVAMVIADETGPAPTPEQMEEVLERAKERPASGAVVLPGKLGDEADAPKVAWTPAADAETAGKVVDFPAPASPPHAPSAEAMPEPKKDIEWAVLMLETLRNYCWLMDAKEGSRKVPWEEYTEAVDMAIAAMRK